MEKIVIRLEIPAISKRYDVLINPEMLVEQVTQLLCRAVEEASNYNYVSSGSEILCLVDEQRVLNRNVQLCKYSIGNGTKIMML